MFIHTPINVDIDKSALSTNTFKATISFGTPAQQQTFKDIQIITFVNNKKVSESKQVTYKVDVKNLNVVNVLVTVKMPNVGQTSKMIVLQVVNNSKSPSLFLEFFYKVESMPLLLMDFFKEEVNYCSAGSIFVQGKSSQKYSVPLGSLYLNMLHLNLFNVLISEDCSASSFCRAGLLH